MRFHVRQPNDAQSTIAGLKAQDCPGGGWTGKPADLERATVADCLAHNVCGCIYGDAALQLAKLTEAATFLDRAARDLHDTGWVVLAANCRAMAERLRK